MPALESWFLEILACPRCHERVTLTTDEKGLCCSHCRVVYPIEDGIPQMLPDSGRPLDPA
jgi:uncharacterized protein YbaR (Trm112 family)